MSKIKVTNPIIPLDYPDPDIIRVDDTYYMVSTTMYFMPGCEILRSYDLVNWEHACFVYDRLDSTDSQRLVDDQNIYGQGMWAASLRYHKGTFFVVFAANDTRKTYLYQTTDINENWKKSEIKGFYHDSSLLFDDDDRVYLVYGNGDIWLTELEQDLSGPKEGGLNKIIISEDNPILGYEGAHLYKINGFYYVFLIHSLPDRWMRTQSCYMAESLEDEFIGKEILIDDRGFDNHGVAQGGVVDTPDGEWYTILFQDHDAVGRLPILIPMKWEKNFPVVGDAGSIPSDFSVESTRPNYEYSPLFGSDDFTSKNNTPHGLKPYWQFNHEPDLLGFEHNNKEGHILITNKKVASTFTQTQNMLTQRMLFPTSAAEVTIEISQMKDGDIAGIAALQLNYAFIGILKEDNQYYIVYQSFNEKEGKEKLMKIKQWNGPHHITLGINVEFGEGQDIAFFSYKKKGESVQLDVEHHMSFDLRHFTGNRYALFNWGTKSTGGRVEFSQFNYL